MVAGRFVPEGTIRECQHCPWTIHDYTTRWNIHEV